MQCLIEFVGTGMNRGQAMMNDAKRQFLIRAGSLAGAGMFSPFLISGCVRREKIRCLLNSGLSGPQAYMFLAQERGYLDEAGVEIEFAAGSGAADVVPRILPEGFDLGYGDLSALIELAANEPDAAPVAVFVAFNSTPLVVVAAADGPVRTPQDLEGRAIGGHPNDAALRAFPAFAARAGIDLASVQLATSPASMRSNVEDTLNGVTAGCFGFLNTVIAAMAGSGVDIKRQLRFFEYRDYTPELYGNALMASRQLIQSNPEALQVLVHGFNQGLRDTAADSGAAIDALMQYAPDIDRNVNLERLDHTLTVEMANPEGQQLGIGDVDDQRLAKAIELVAESYPLPRIPQVDEIFTREFLPSTSQRLTTLTPSYAHYTNKYPMLLNSGWTGAQAWFHTAAEHGFLRQEALVLDFQPGRGAYTAAPRMLAEGFDLAYGDVNSLVEVVAAMEPDAGPQAVYMMFSASPSTIAVAADGPIQSAQDLPGRTILGDSSDVALQTFPAFAASQGIDVGSVSIESTDLPKSDLIEKMLNEEGDVAAMFGYVTTITAAARGIGTDPARLRFINYRDALPDFYGSALMVSREFQSNHPDVVASVVRAINRGVMLTVQDPASGIAALVQRAPDVDRATELERLIGTLSGEMNHPETREIGYGDADDERLTAAIALLCQSKGLARIPATNEIFTRQFLPPVSKRTPV
jgi:NitT/TauT family transport system substrate-binding protein